MRQLALLSSTALAVLTATPAAAGTEIITYTYDVRGRLEKVERDGDVNNGVDTSYTLDKADNRLSVSTVGSPNSPPPLPVSFSISSNGAVTEGSPSVFTVAKTDTATGSLSVNYASASGSATSGSDFTATSGTLTFLASESSKTISVPTTDDSSVESAESFTMTLSGASGGTIGTAQATATINDNDVAGPSFSINDPVAEELQPLVFTITRSGPTTGTYTLNYASANGTAVAPGDYAAVSGTLTFAPGETTKTVSVTTNGGGPGEQTEYMYLNLSSPSGNSTISDAQGLGSILNLGQGGGGGGCTVVNGQVVCT